MTSTLQTDLVIREPGPGASAALRPFLVVLGPGTPSVVQLPAGRVVIGRSSACSVRIDHQTVSRRHASLATDGELRLTDLGSSNGIRVGGRLLAAGESVVLRVGEVFELGRTTLLVHASPHLPGLLARAPATPPEIVEQDTGLVVRSPAMTRLLTLVDRVAKSRLSVLVTGETGVGKERVADLLHRRSDVWAGPLVKMNCGALNPLLVESELFGHARGAFTGATEDKPGLLEQAAGGTLLLDEVCALPLHVQTKLLRVVQERSVRRVGGHDDHPTAERFIATTSRDIDEALETGAFRTDLYYRIAGVRLGVPPLRERREEIRPLAHHLLDRLAARDGVYPPRLSDEAWAALDGYGWPGNVRELRNVLERAWITAGSDDVELSHLPPEVAAVCGRRVEVGSALVRSLATLERQKILEALEACDGNQTRAAKLLGISRRTLVNRLDKYDVPRPRKGRDA